MENRINGLMNYLDGAHSVFHAVEGLKNRLEEAGYTRLQESGKWELVPGGKYYLTRGGSALIAQKLGERKPEQANRLFSLVVYTSLAVGVAVTVCVLAVKSGRGSVAD